MPAMRSIVRAVNFPLITGLVLAGVVLLIAFLGPYYAPRNPLEETHVAQVDGKWLNAPFPPFTVPGFPLGSDHFGEFFPTGSRIDVTLQFCARRGD